MYIIKAAEFKYPTSRYATKKCSIFNIFDILNERLVVFATKLKEELS